MFLHFCCILLASSITTSNGFLYPLNLEINLKMNKLMDNNYQIPKAIETHYITQRLNNFDMQDSRSWENRYMQNSDYYEHGGPVFVFINGHTPIQPYWLSYGLAHDIARDNNGTIIGTEHRFYGNSRPTEDLSIENLRFLSHDQALADIANLVSSISNDPTYEHSPIILVSQQYGASLASWFRIRYPHLVDGVWSSSARLEARADLTDYLIDVSENILLFGGFNCQNRIEGAFQEIEDIINSNDDGEELSELFNLCQPLDVDDEFDVGAFVHTLAMVFGVYVEYGGDLGIELSLCPRMLNESFDTDLEALADFISFVFSANPCLNITYTAQREEFLEEEWGAQTATLGNRQWGYQLCSEFGWFRGSMEEQQPFTNLFPHEYFYDVCADIYGTHFGEETLTRQINRNNNNNGGLNPIVSNVIYTSSSLDPWRSVGITDDEIDGSHVFVIPGETMSADLHSLSQSDSPELQQIKNDIREIITDWIN